MPRLKKASEKLNDYINVPVNRGLKKRILRIAEAKGLPTHTPLARTYIERGIEADEKTTAVSSEK